MSDTLLADDLLLLLLDDESGKLNRNSLVGVETAIGGALLVELSLLGTVELGEKERFRSPKVVAATAPTSLPPILRAALDDVLEKERTAASLVQRLGKDRKEEVLARLVDRGMIRAEKDKVLGLFPRTRWPAEDSSHEETVRSKIRESLLAERAVDDRTAAVIALLSAYEVIASVMEIDGMKSRELRKRAKAIGEGAWGSEALRDAVEAAQAAVIVAVGAASVAAST
ncbi:MAG: GPP34 family phosphoprotein [Ilumatobacter sp.]